MCLTIISERYWFPRFRSALCWKVMMERADGTLFSWPREFEFTERGVWVSCGTKLKVHLPYSKVQYQAGWHAYTHEQDAKIALIEADSLILRSRADKVNLRVVPVYLRGIHTRGEQHSFEIIVADLIRVPTQVELVTQFEEYRRRCVDEALEHLEKL